MNGLKISKMQVINNPREDAKIPIIQNGTNYSMPFGTFNKLITQIYEDYDIPNALQQLQVQIDSADAATARANDTAAHPGYVGNDGYYYKWNVETKTYEKTDANLKGEKGDAFRYEDFTPEQVSALMAPATDAATEVARRLTELTDSENDMATAEEQRETSVHNALEDIAEASGKADAATDACNTATTNANDATAAANTATTNAVAATEAAVTAKQNADVATAAATSATGLANTAAAEATTAKQNADAATDAATTAAAEATTAKQNADAATDATNTAANAATTAANTANTAADAVNNAVHDAETAIANAETATQNATTATDAATTATGLANTAATKADAATDAANTATTNANDATGLANTATTNADAATDTANTAANAATTAADAAINSIMMYDCSAKGTITFATLDLAIAAVPLAYQKGGLHIKFVDTASNKYNTYFLATSTWSTVISDWQSSNEIITNSLSKKLDSSKINVLSEDEYTALTTKEEGKIYFIYS